jgi:hypothetical protein
VTRIAPAISPCVSTFCAGESRRVRTIRPGASAAMASRAATVPPWVTKLKAKCFQGGRIPGSIENSGGERISDRITLVPPGESIGFDHCKSRTRSRQPTAFPKSMPGGTMGKGPALK